VKGIILAGGTGSRLSPLTDVTNKHLLPVGKKPMIVHSVEKLVSENISDIMIVTGTEHMGDMISLLGSGKRFNCNLTYRVQDEADGIAGALSLCENFSQGGPIIVILGDNIFSDSLHASIKKFNNIKKSPKCSLSLIQVDDPGRFGVPLIKNEKIIKIIEKPEYPESNYCVTGIYLYDKNVFRFISQLRKSGRGEYEITDVNNSYIKEGHVGYTILNGWWTDAGTHESYHAANSLCLDSQGGL